MMPKIKNSNYFPHDCSARDDQKLLKVRGRFGLEGYAIFWMCLESMSTNGGYIEIDSVSGLAVTFGTSEAQLMAQLEYLCEVGLFLKNKEGYHSSRMDEHLLFRKERSESGKRGAETRWGDSSAIAQPKPEPMVSKVKESKVNKYYQQADSTFTGNLFGTEIKKPVSTTRWQQMALDYSKKFGFEPSASWFKFFKNGNEAKLQDTYAKMFGLTPNDPEKYFYKLYGGNYAPDTTK